MFRSSVRALVVSVGGGGREGRREGRKRESEYSKK